jgi:hypothetical protein
MVIPSVFYPAWGRLRHLNGRSVLGIHANFVPMKTRKKSLSFSHFCCIAANVWLSMHHGDAHWRDIDAPAWRCPWVARVWA